MRSIATCYSDHAVRVSDSYCSGPLNRSYVSPKSIPAVQSDVSQTFKARISGEDHPLFAAVTWCNKLICQGFFLNLSRTTTGPHHQLGKPKGNNKRVEFHESGSGLIINAVLYWDLTSARFESGPEPLGFFYIVILLPDSQSAVVLGDMESDPGVIDLVNGYRIRTLSLISQCEHYAAHWSNPISTRVKFSGSGSDHEVIIKCGPEDDGPRSPVLSISIDKKRVVRVRRLQWNFRGNQVIFVDGLLVDVMWDVFGWFFYHQRLNNNNIINNNNNNNSNCGVFMFRTRSGLDSRLWLEEEEKKFDHQNQKHDDDHDNKPHFALLISANSKNPT